MSGLLFVPQTTLDGWLEAGSVDIVAEGLQVVAEDRVFTLDPAFRFVTVLEGQDENDLLSRVKTEAQVKALGGDACGDSVILGEVAYQVEPGFLAIVPEPAVQTQAAPEGAAPARAIGEAMRQRQEEADLLSRFLLEQLK